MFTPAKTQEPASKTSAAASRGKPAPFIQPRLTINQPGDEYEREADEMAEKVMRMPAPNDFFFQPASISMVQRKCDQCEKEQEEPVQRKSAGEIVQRQDEEETPSPDGSPPPPTALQPAGEPDFLSLRQPFFNRGIYHLWDSESALGVWNYNFGFFRRFGLSADLSASLSNFTAPRFIDSQLKAGNPLWWEITDRELNTTSFVGSIPVLDFNADFSPAAPSWVRSVFGGGSSVRRKEASPGAPSVSSPLNSYVQSLPSSGSPMPAATKDFFGPRFGFDFSSVKLHYDEAAISSAQSVNALAYTTGNHIVFNRNQFSPESDAGKKLLAHELTHVIQQAGGIRLSPAGKDEPVNEVTEEIIDLSRDELVPDFDAPLPPSDGPSTGNGIAKAGEPVYTEIQTKPVGASLQRNTPPAEAPRKDYVFLMGSTGGFYLAARRFFKDHHPTAEIISLKDNSLAGLFAKLRDVASPTSPVGNLYIVSHANVDGTLSFGLTGKDKDKKTTFGELTNALKTSPGLFKLSGGVDGKTTIHIKGCNIGRNTDMLNALDEAFGKNAQVVAPTHKQGYEYHTTGKGPAAVVVSSEYFNTYNVEFAGKAAKSDDELIAAFKEKYAGLGFSDQDWEIAVLGKVKQGKKVDQAAAEKVREVEARLKSGLAALDKKAADYKTEKQRLESEAKTERSDIAQEAKDAKVTQVAKGSAGAVKKVITPFTATLFNSLPAPSTETEILKQAPAWFAKTGKGGWKFLSASVTQSRVDSRDHFDYAVAAENKDGRFNLQYSLDMAALPKSGEDAQALAEALMVEHSAKNPEFAVSRRDSYEWTINTVNKKGVITVTANLDMTLYTIDLDFREKGGATLDAGSKKGDQFYFGESTIQPKLAINQPGDQFEREADEMAERVMRMPVPEKFNTTPVTEPSLRQKGGQRIAIEKAVDRKGINGKALALQASTGRQADHFTGSASLPESTRQFFEPRFGYDFSSVQIHNDAAAHDSAKNIQALAYTYGSHIVFGDNQFSPESDAGKKLIAHELAHVVQQSGSGKSIQRFTGPATSFENCDGWKTDPQSFAIAAAREHIHQQNKVYPGNASSVKVDKESTITRLEVRFKNFRVIVIYDEPSGFDNREVRIRTWNSAKECFYRFSCINGNIQLAQKKCEAYIIDEL
jgi:hypothetical protein